LSEQERAELKERAQSHLTSAQHSAQSWERALEAAKAEVLEALEELKEEQSG